MIEKLKKGIENLEEDFYEEVKLNSQEIIDDRVYEIDLYFENLKDIDYSLCESAFWHYYKQLEEEYSLWESHTSEYEYELYLINEELSEFYNFIDNSYPK